VYNGTHGITTTGVQGEPRSLPTTTAVVFDLPDAPLIRFSLVVSGRLAGNLLAGGAASSTVQQGSRDTQLVELFPVDPCVAGAVHCGGVGGVFADPSSLYVCGDGYIQFYAKCALGCTSHVGEGDVCIGIGECSEGGAYCGGDQLDGDPNTLYVCHDLAGTSPTRCPHSCVVASAGGDFCT
jgi:hypothetical protein